MPLCATRLTQPCPRHPPGSPRAERLRAGPVAARYLTTRAAPAFWPGSSDSSVGPRYGDEEKMETPSWDTGLSPLRSSEPELVVHSFEMDARETRRFKTF